MKPRDLTDLLLLATIWGASFLFMRVAVPAFGPVGLAFVRVAGAALFLLPLLLARGEAPVLRQRWRAMLALGLTNSALPFLLFGYAVYTLPAGLAAIFNAATPLCTALIAWAWLGDPLDRWRSLGLALGFAGVAGLAVVKSISAPAGASLAALQIDQPTLLAIGACLLGTLLYGYAGNHAKRHLAATDASYLQALSADSQRSLVLQGGPMDAAGQTRFLARPYAEQALRLRRLDEAAKQPGMATRPLEALACVLTRCLRGG